MIKISLHTNNGQNAATVQNPLLSVDCTYDGSKIALLIFPLQKSQTIIQAANILIRNEGALKIENSKTIKIYQAKRINQFAHVMTPDLAGEKLFFQARPLEKIEEIDRTKLSIRSNDTNISFASKILRSSFSFLKEVNTEYLFQIKQKQDQVIVYEELLQPFLEKGSNKNYVKTDVDLVKYAADICEIENENYYLDHNKEIQAKHFVFGIQF